MTEEQPEGTPPEGTPPEGTPPEGTPPEGTPPKETKEDNWEQRHKDLQADHTRKSQELAEANRRIEQLEQPPEEPDEDLDLGGDEEYVDRKTVNKLIATEVRKAVGQVRTEAADAYFRRTYRDLVQHEGVIAGIMRNPTKPPKKGASAEERIDAAVEEFKSLTAEAVEKAKVDAETEAKAKEEAKRKASGLGAGSPSPPPKGDEDVSDEQEVANRKARQAKKRNLA